MVLLHWLAQTTTIYLLSSTKSVQEKVHLFFSPPLLFVQSGNVSSMTSCLISYFLTRGLTLISLTDPLPYCHPMTKHCNWVKCRWTWNTTSSHPRSCLQWLRNTNMALMCQGTSNQCILKGSAVKRHCEYSEIWPPIYPSYRKSRVNTGMKNVGLRFLRNSNKGWNFLFLTRVNTSIEYHF